jgi:site-specific recombinase XerD
MLRACGSSPLGVRNRAHLALIYRTGMRVASSCALEREDVFTESEVRHVRVERVKRNSRVLTFVLDTRASELLDAWLALRGDEPGPLFRTSSGQAIQTSYMRRLCKLLARRAGIRRRVHPHGLRHAFAAELYREGAGVIEIGLALGHSKIATTQVYLQSIGATEVNERLRGRKW